MTLKHKIHVILGSTRPNRFSEKPGRYLVDELNKRADVEAELVDLRDWPLPFFDEAMAPAMNQGKYANELGKKWATKVGEADAFVIVTPEYNHGYPAVLKNAIDWVATEWYRKPVAFVGYGNAGGARAIEQLRQVVAELFMFPTRSALHLPVEVYMALRTETAPVNPELFKPMREGPRGDRIETVFKELLELSTALKTMRQPK